MLLSTPLLSSWTAVPCIQMIQQNDSQDGEHSDEMTLVSGDFFGEIAILKQMPRSADVVALGYCALLALKRQDLETIMKTDAELNRTIKEVGEARLNALGL